MKTSSSSFSLLGSLGLVLGLSVGSQAATLTFGTAIGATNYNSDGSALEQGTDTDAAFFELGVFVDPGTGNEFIPNIDNIADWDANFLPLKPGASVGDSIDPIAYDSGAPYVTGAVAFGDGTGVDAALQVTNAVVPAGLQVYLWGYQSRTITPGEYTDWVLITGDSGGATPTETNWLTPNVSDTTQQNLNLTWDVHNSTTAVVGKTSESTGSGDMTGTPPPMTPDNLQFAAVPEPSTALLLSLSALTFCMRRKR